MPKRKLQDEDEVFADDAPVPASSNNGKHSRNIDDVTINGQDFGIVQPCPSIPVQKNSTHPNLVSRDKGRKDTLDQKAGMIPERLLGRADHVDATPPSLANEYEESEDFEGTPIGIEAEMPVAKNAECYNMGHSSRGTCLVFNHEIFEEGTSNRKGSNIDVRRIQATFGNLGFDVVVHSNLKYNEIMDKIQTLTQPNNHADSDCVCVFVLTHGLNDDLLLAKDVAYSSDKIWKPFTADNCRTLAGKPKLFFFQACRGVKSDGGVLVVTQSSDDNNDQIDSIKASYTIPTLSDFLIAHSCADGFYSWRNTEEGTWYVQSLCSVLDEFSASTDLMEMLTITARKVAIDFQSCDPWNPDMDAQKQIPSVTSTLTRDLYFTPK